MTHANTLLQQAESQCHINGVRFTPIRRRVLELIAENGGGLKAYDLLDKLSTVCLLVGIHHLVVVLASLCGRATFRRDQ